MNTDDALAYFNRIVREAVKARRIADLAVAMGDAARSYGYTYAMAHRASGLSLAEWESVAAAVDAGDIVWPLSRENPILRVTVYRSSDASRPPQWSFDVTRKPGQLGEEVGPLPGASTAAEALALAGAKFPGANIVVLWGDA
jgi:hypothetical protein